MELQRDESFLGMLARGVVLWRPIHFVGQEMSTELPEFEFEKSKANQYVAKVKLEEDFIWEPTLLPVHSTAGLGNYGIIVFVNGEVAVNWTHLLISGISTGLRANPRKRGGCIFADTTEPAMDIPAYCNFRRKLAQSVIVQENEDFEKRVRITEEHPGHTGNRRLVFRRFSTGDTEFQYEHLEDPR